MLYSLLPQQAFYPNIPSFYPNIPSLLTSTFNHLLHIRHECYHRQP
jgi:hypothetical protein